MWQYFMTRTLVRVARYISVYSYPTMLKDPISRCVVLVSNGTQVIPVSRWWD